MIRIPTNREPTHPGKMLLEEFLEPLELSPLAFANEIGLSYQLIDDIISKRQGVTEDIAEKLGSFFNMSTQFWLNLQMCWDLYWEKQGAVHIQSHHKYEYALA